MDVKTLSQQAQALLKRLSRYQLIDKPDGSVVLGAWGYPGDEFTAADRAVLLEIKQVLLAERAAEQAAAAERQALIDAIPGLQAIRDAADEWEAYIMAFNAMMDDENNDGARPPKRPTSDVKALMQAYPVASAYLKAISIHAPREGCDSKSAQNASCLLRQNLERSFDKRHFHPKSMLFVGEKRHRHVILFQIVLFIR